MRTREPSSAEHKQQGRHSSHQHPLAATAMFEDHRSEAAQLRAMQSLMSHGLGNQSLRTLQAKMHAGTQQQSTRPVAQLKKGVAVNDDAALEAEADVMGAKALGAGQSAAHTSHGFAAAPALQTPATQRVIQRYEPKNSEVDSIFLVHLVKEKRWIKAQLISIEKDRGWNFKPVEEQGDDIFIANHRNIKKLPGDGDSEEQQSSKKRSYFDSETTYTHCQAPGCGAAFANKDELYDHVRLTHAFPRERHYPYLLFGGQNALTHVLSRDTKKDEQQEQQRFTGSSKATGNGFHSEWNAGRFVPKKRFKDDSHPEFSATTSVPEFMGKQEDAPSSLFVTGEPHCGICSNTLPKSGLPLGYPTNARPSQSQAYNIPTSTPHMDQVFGDFSGRGQNPDYETPEYKGFRREHFPPRLETAPSYNKKLEEQHSDKGGEQYMKFMAQSMALNKDRYDNFFENLGEGDMERDDLKRQMAQYPVPEHPQTFMPYCPSPLYKPTDSEEDQSYEKQRQKLLAERIIIAIAQALKKIVDSGGELEIELKEGEIDYLQPLAINNCLITAINGGVAASLDIVGLIRFLIREQVGTPYGAYLQARPEVIYTIAQALQLTNRHIRIYTAGQDTESEESTGEDDRPSQLFIIQGDGSVIEAEGDEMDEYPPPTNGYIDIEHMGGNHFAAKPN